MEYSDWLPSLVALIVGIGSVFLTNWFSEVKEKRNTEQKRRDALTAYERDLTDWYLYYFSQMGAGAGNHPRPREQELKDSWAAAYPYLQEFKGHPLLGSLLSPYYEQMPGDYPYDPMEFYERISVALDKHIQKYPKKPEAGPYLKGDGIE